MATKKKSSHSKKSAEALARKLIAAVRAAGLGAEAGAAFLVDTGLFVAQHAYCDEESFRRFKSAAYEIVRARQWPYPTRDSGPIDGHPDGLTWADADDWLRERGSSLEDLAREKLMGAAPWEKAS